MIFTEYKIDDLCLYITSGGTPKATNLQYYDNGTIPWMKTGEIHKGYIYNTETHITQEALKNSSAKLIPANSIIIAMYGDGGTAGNVAINKIPLSTNQACCNLVVNSEICNYQYLYFFLKGSYNDLVALKSGGSQQNLNGKTIKEFKILLPALPIQNIIASILSAYDELIENNKQRIKLLEEMAEEIYKEWFVRFRFPGYENAKIVDGLPEGWENGTIGDLVEFKKGKNITLDTVSEGNVPVVAGGLTPAYYHNVANTISPTITISASGANAGFVNLYYEDIWASDCSFLDSNSTDTLFFFYLTLKTRQNEVFFLQKGSAQPHVYPKDIMTLKIKRASIDLIEKFEDLIKPFFEEIKILSQKNQLLQETRDLLLPRLISGKLNVEHLLDEKEDLLMVAEPRAEYQNK